MRILFFLLLLAPFAGKTQDLFVVIDSIEITGNKRTLDEIVLRELNFKIGDSIVLEKLPTTLSDNNLLLLNTGLFTRADINIKNWNEAESRVVLKIHLDEAWYIYPLPILELADRNFNVWWTEYNRDLKRVNWGGHFFHTNFTGRRDYFKLVAQFGYTRKYELKYSLPYLNKKKTLGIEAVTNYKQQHEIQYNTVNNKQQFYRTDDVFNYERLESRITFSHRPKIRTNHYFSLIFHQNTVSDTIAILNPDFFLNGRTKQQYLGFLYRFDYDSRNIHPYPTKGKKFAFELSKSGLGLFNHINSFSAKASYSQYFPLSKKWSTGHNLRNRTALIRNSQPYFNSQALGFGTSFVRGYEFYVIDGIDFFLSRNTISCELINKSWNLGKSMPLKAFRRLPLKLYLTAFGDIGYAHNPSFRDTNPFSNKALTGYGAGLNLVLYYDKVLILEYSFNGEGENGLFVRTEVNF